MKKRKNTKSALFTSVISLLICFTMLIGTTFAWFTDSVTSSNNIIKTGTLDIELEKWDGKAWVDASKTPIFDYDNWEPGYINVQLLKVTNNGTLALKWKATFASESKLTKLADVIDVYVLPYGVLADASSVAYPENRNLTDCGYTRVGTLAQFVNTIESTTYGELLAGEEAYLGIALKMQESAGNEYAGIDIGGKFDIQILATQYTYEDDSFDNQYDANAKYVTSASTLDAFFNAIENGDDVLLTEQISVNRDFIDYINERYSIAAFALGDKTQVIGSNAIINGNGITVYRTAETAGAPLFAIDTGYTLTLSNITLDGGAKWTGATDATLLRGTTNSGIKTGANVIATSGNASIVLEEGAVIQNNDGANAISLATRGGGSLIINGGEIINNTSAAGAIWGGGKITVNSGKINGNHATSIGGAIRMVDGYNNGSVSFTMTGGEMNHNKSDGNGGAIWGGNRAVYTFSGGEMAYNSAVAGGAIWTGTYETYIVSGDFKLHNNSATELGGAIRFCDHASLTMTGGSVYNNTIAGKSSAFYLNNNSATITDGSIADNFSYSGGLGLTVGEADIAGVIEYSLGTNHKTAYLAAEFNSFSFTVNPDHVGNFNFKPATDYIYTEGDEAKLKCLNDGYETYWDAATGTFRLQAK